MLDALVDGKRLARQREVASEVHRASGLGKYSDGTGYIGAINIDLPYWGDYEVRSTIRFSAVPTDTDITSAWVDLGVSIGYEF